MKISKVHIQNFLTIGEASPSLDEKGLVLIQGVNEDDPSANSNGAGKSSLPDALCWSLYGETARGAKGDSVVNRAAKKDCAVTVTILDEEDEYIISRGRKHTTLKNRVMISKNGKDITKGTDKLTQDSINQIVGCSSEVFRAAVYAGQESMPDLPGMTDKNLKILVEESAGIDVLQMAHEKAKEGRTLASKALEEVIRKMTSSKESISHFENEINESEKLRSKETMMMKEREDSARDTAKRKLELAKNQVTLYKYASKDAENLSSELLGIAKEVSGVSAEGEKLEELRKEGSKLSSIVDMASSRDKATEAEGRRAVKELEDVMKKVGEDCGECGKTHTERDLKSLTKIAEHKVNAKLDERVETQKRLNAVSKDCESATKALESFKSSMTDVSKLIERERDINSLLGEIDRQASILEASKKSAQSAVDALKLIKSSKNPFIEIVERLVERQKAEKKKMATLNREMKEKSEVFKLAENAVSVFGPAGVRAHILDSVTPFLNERTSHYLGTLSDGNIEAVWSTLTKTAKGEIREKFNIEVSSRTGADNFICLSGGEKRKVRLATAMALQDMVASRAIKPIGLFIADEVDHALDDAGLERLMSLLDEKARERGTVLVISHNELSDWVRDHATIIKKGGLAKITGALN